MRPLELAMETIHFFGHRSNWGLGCYFELKLYKDNEISSKSYEIVHILKRFQVINKIIKREKIFIRNLTLYIDSIKGH